MDYQSPEVRRFLEKKARPGLRSGTSSALDKFIKKTPRRADGTLPDDVMTIPFSNNTTPGADFRVGSHMFLSEHEMAGEGGSRGVDCLFINTSSGMYGGDAAAALGLGTSITSPGGMSDLSSVVISSPGYSSVASTPVAGTAATKKRTKLDHWLHNSPKTSIASNFKPCHNIPKALEEEEQRQRSVSPKTFFCRTSYSSTPRTSSSRTESTTPTNSKTPTPQPGSSLTRTESGDSLGQEMVHFRPIVSSPRTPPRKLPGGKLHDPPVVRSTPRNLLFPSPKKNENKDEDCDVTIPITSPMMQRSLRLLEAQRQAHVSSRAFIE